MLIVDMQSNNPRVTIFSALLQKFVIWKKMFVNILRLTYSNCRWQKQWQLFYVFL